MGGSAKGEQQKPWFLSQKPRKNHGKTGEKLGKPRKIVKNWENLGKS